MAPGLMASIGTWHPVTPAYWDLKMVLFPNKLIKLCVINPKEEGESGQGEVPCV